MPGSRVEDGKKREEPKKNAKEKSGSQVKKDKTDKRDSPKRAPAPSTPPIPRSVEVTITHGQRTTPFLLYSQIPLHLQLPIVCQLLATSEQPLQAEKFVLKTKSGETVSEKSVGLLAGAELVLAVRPVAVVAELLTALADPERRAKAVFSLCEQLVSYDFCHEFWAQGGLALLARIIKEAKGNLLAYAFTALELSISNGFGWDFLTTSVIEKIAATIANPDEHPGNVRMGALKLAVQLTTSRKTGYPALYQALKADSERDPLGALPVFQGLVSNLRDSDMNVQSASFALVGNFCRNAGTPELRVQRVREMDRTFPPITAVLRGFMRPDEVEELRVQAREFVRTKVALLYDERLVRYDPARPEHTERLRQLWALADLGPLDDLVSEKWKLLGFQGRDPATDFRGMGTVGLNHLLYFAEKQNALFKKIVHSQQGSEDHNVESKYPFATAGINVSRLLFELLLAPGTRLDLLFEDGMALEHLYIIACRALDEAWRHTGATYMEFQAVTDLLHDIMLQALAAPSLEAANSLALQLAGKASLRKKKDEKQRRDRKGTYPVEVAPVAKRKEDAARLVKGADTTSLAHMIAKGDVSVRGLDGLPLHTAVVKGNIDMVSLLLWQDAEMNAVDTAGNTPLHIAAKRATLEMVEFLLLKGASVGVRNKKDELALHRLVGRGFEDAPLLAKVVEAMVAAGAEPNSQTAAGDTPLHYAARSREETPWAINFLLEAKADPNVKNRNDEAPLHTALRHHRKLAVRLLVEYGADVGAKCRGRAPAELTSNQEVLRMLDPEFTPALARVSDEPASPQAAAALLAQALTELNSVEAELPPAVSAGDSWQLTKARVRAAQRYLAGVPSLGAKQDEQLRALEAELALPTSPLLPQDKP